MPTIIGAHDDTTPLSTTTGQRQGRLASLQPNAAELIQAGHEATTDLIGVAKAMHGDLLPMLDTDEWVRADSFVRAATLAVAGLHWHFIVAPAGRRQLREAALDVRGAAPWAPVLAGWPSPDRVASARGPVQPARCDACHGRLTGAGDAA